MYTFLKSKPRSAVVFQPPDDSKIWLHPRENKSAFDKLIKYENFMHEMMKFFPGFIQEGCQTGKETTLKAEGIGEWAEGWNLPPAPSKDKGSGHTNWTRSYYTRGVIEGAYLTKYGDFHAQYLDHNYWGYKGGIGAENMDWSPSASEYRHFSDLDPEGTETPIDLGEYSSLVYSPGTAPALAAIDQGLFDTAKNWLNSGSFKGRSFYEIAMTGVANSSIDTTATINLDYNDDGVAETVKSIATGVYTATHNGGFLYDSMGGSAGEGAFYLMLSLIESRRRINYAMSSVFGAPYMINDNQAMLNHIAETFTDQDKLGGINAQNAKLLEAYFGIQHQLRSVMPGYSGGYGFALGGETDINNFTGGDDGHNGYFYSARDMVGFQRFRHWMSANIGTYISTLSNNSNPDMAAKVRTLYNEFIYLTDTQQPDTQQPYGGGQYWQTNNADGTWTANPAFNAWDRFHSGVTKDVGWDNFPNGATPQMIDDTTNHYNYAVNQLFGATPTQIMGYQVFSANGHTTNLFETNWVARVEGLIYRWEKEVLAENMNALAMTNMDRLRYKKAVRAYRKWKVEKMEKEYQEKVDEARFEAQHNEKMKVARADKKGDSADKNPKAAPPPPKKNNKPEGDSTQKLKKAQDAIRMSMLKKMFDNGKARNNRQKG